MEKNILEEQKQCIKQKLFTLVDNKYKEFHKNLCPTMKKEMIGVKIPILRKYAKYLLQQQDIENLMKMIDDQYYEEIMLQGLVIGLNKEENFEKVKKQIQNFIPKIDNWAVCDTFCAGLKITKRHKEEMWDFIQQYLRSKEEFSIRFGIVMILDYYIEQRYLEEIFEIFNDIYKSNQEDKYYVQMAVAWTIAEILVKFYDEGKKYIQIAKIDKFTHNKAIQKAVDSFRITKEKKEELKKLKKF